MRSVIFVGVAVLGAIVSSRAAITFHKDFESGSFSRIENVSSNHFRCHVEGQTDERGRNRQATWYFFRIDGARGRELSVSLTNFVGEYNDKPGAVSMNAETIPVFSHDGEHWQHFAAMDWNNTAKEATVRVRVERESVWIAHVPPYGVARLQRLLGEVKGLPHTRVEVIGQSVERRDLHLVTVTDSTKPDTARTALWLIARQHAWEAGTSFVMEGALRFVTSDDPKARALRERFVFKFVPMMAHDGVIRGKVRFNMNGYDINRHWDEPNWEGGDFRQRMPEIWSVKKALFAWLDAGRKIDLMVNLHNTETGEYLRTQADDTGTQALFQRLEENLMAKTSFDPGTRITFAKEEIRDTNSLWRQRRIPVALMEQRISLSRKLGHRPTVEDRLQFGRDLIGSMAETASR
jgi:hypothetical protein